MLLLGGGQHLAGTGDVFELRREIGLQGGEVRRFEARSGERRPLFGQGRLAFGERDDRRPRRGLLTLGRAVGVGGAARDLLGGGDIVGAHACCGRRRVGMFGRTAHRAGRAWLQVERELAGETGQAAGAQVDDLGLGLGVPARGLGDALDGAGVAAFGVAQCGGAAPPFVEQRLAVLQVCRALTGLPRCRDRGRQHGQAFVEPRAGGRQGADGRAGGLDRGVPGRELLLGQPGAAVGLERLAQRFTPVGQQSGALVGVGDAGRLQRGLHRRGGLTGRAVTDGGPLGRAH